MRDLWDSKYTPNCLCIFVGPLLERELQYFVFDLEGLFGGSSEQGNG